MGNFEVDYPTDILNDLKSIYDNSDKIFGEMTKAGANVVLEHVKATAPFPEDSEIWGTLKLTKVYKTPSDGGINTKVGFYGYFRNRNGVKTPAPLVCNVFEYGSSKFAKRPFFRKAFKKQEIEAVMLAKQKELTGGKLDE